ncbi:tagaturonate epimerase family protein [Gracilibacillus sp. S3-1-1]|uniref:Tagaturonate epimerase family protein n=1 Tax=Gracilibacillus pellucidus TaxID=3095368 RepID=A0ACC6M2Q0_9BACI|nr:tagaturonate epimerase family protein [Gracilibacillus sp. S3-1-1]MDX8045155.1 tagaturonate epimerase family protein [Gracilibacillus sp. S3-1-1]
MEQFQSVVKALQEGQSPESSDVVKVYQHSLEKQDNVSLIMVKAAQTKYLIAVGDGPLFDALNGEVVQGGKVCPLTHENSQVLNQFFDYTKPQAFGTDIATMGLGDRLGLASPGHIETVRDRKVKPILAQQSIRELTLLNRTMTDILDAATFAVFQEGYKDGYGADADHIKLEEDIKYALDLGFSFITLDCSEQIRNGIEEMSVAEVSKEFASLPAERKDYYSTHYVNKSFDADGLNITFDEASLHKNVLVYGEAIDFMEHVYNAYISKAEKAIDFEISIDETETVTAPEAHFFVAEELRRRGVTVQSLAPRFCGEFQKGIDYIGDITQFEKELQEHAEIAKYFGYKLSIHSGSDKFSVFPIIGKYTEGLLHIKTAGTNWLEAVRVIAQVNPDLYRRMHVYAEEHFEETLKYYHVTPDLDSVAPLNETKDEELPSYMDHDASRQLFHVTYGILLTAQDEAGNDLFNTEFFTTLINHEDAYRESLVKHIGRHVDLLGL